MRNRRRPRTAPRWLLGLAVLFVVGCGQTVQALPIPPSPTAYVPQPVVFPRDAGSHDALTEWWYYTGHLHSVDQSQQYGFELTVFQLRRRGAPTGYLAHFAVSDITGKAFSHQSKFVTGEFQPDFNLNVQGWTMRAEGSHDQLSATMDAGPGAETPYTLDLQTTDLKPPALHNGTGYIDYGPAGGSCYYSRTRLDVTGQIGRVGSQPMSVSGTAWMDHQWGDFVIVSSGGWDWYSIQLDDNSELMLYVLRGADGQVSAVYGSQVKPDGTVVDLDPATTHATATGSWTSPHTGAVYPSGWTVQTGNGALSLQLTPQLQDQELYFPGAAVNPLSYWEGAVTVRGENGAPNGLGYVELTGYAPTSSQ